MFMGLLLLSLHFALEYACVCIFMHICVHSVSVTQNVFCVSSCILDRYIFTIYISVSGRVQCSVCACVFACVRACVLCVCMCACVLCVCMCACVRVCYVFACVRACVRVCCVFACVRACVCAVCLHVCVRVCCVFKLLDLPPLAAPCVRHKMKADLSGQP